MQKSNPKYLPSMLVGAVAGGVTGGMRYGWLGGAIGTVAGIVTGVIVAKSVSEIHDRVVEYKRQKALQRATMPIQPSASIDPDEIND